MAERDDTIAAPAQGSQGADVKVVTGALDDLPVEVRLHRLEALVAASESLNRASGLNEILRTILDHLYHQLRCDRATVFLLDSRTDKLHARQMIGSEHIEILLERGRGIAGYVAERGESVLINDVQNDPRFDRATDERTGYTTLSMLCVPLRKPEGTLLGSLQALNAEAGAFSETDLAYVESFAALAAVAVEREQLAQEAMRSQLISTELELARTIQQRLLPAPGHIQLPTPLSAWGVSQPCYDVGGDAYDAVVLPNGDCAFWIVDVSGKGIGAALLMTTLQTELRAIVREHADLAQLAAELNTRVGRVAPTGTYATLFLGLLSPRTRALRYVNAGHLTPLWWLPYEGAIADCDCTAGGLPVGLLPGAAYEEGRGYFPAGARLALFTDGLTDAENTAGDTYEAEGVTASLAAIDSPDPVHLGTRLLADLDRFRMSVPANDDTTLLVIGIDD
jgi:serine phosphatase RsbU (regulator of sigma subunit)